MLKRLGLHAVIGGDRQDRVVDASGAGEHSVDEALVARNVDEADRRPRRHGHVSETKVNRDAARLLFLEAIAIDSRQRPHQGRFAVVDMPSQPENHGCPSGATRDLDGGGSMDIVASFLRCARLDRKACSSVRQRKSSTRRSFSMRPITGVGKPRSLRARSSTTRAPPEARMERPVLSIVSSGRAPEPIWLRHWHTSTTNSAPSDRAT